MEVLEDVLCSVMRQAGKSQGGHDGEDLQWHYMLVAVQYDPLSDMGVGSRRMGCRPTCNIRARCNMLQSR